MQKEKSGALPPDHGVALPQGRRLFAPPVDRTLPRALAESRAHRVWLCFGCSWLVLPRFRPILELGGCHFGHGPRTPRVRRCLCSTMAECNFPNPARSEATSLVSSIALLSLDQREEFVLGISIETESFPAQRKMTIDFELALTCPKSKQPAPDTFIILPQ